MFDLFIYYIKKILNKISNKEKFEGTYAYREYLFKDLIENFGTDRFKNKRFLEIGPKDGEDTERLQKLSPEQIILFDLPDKSVQNEEWKHTLGEKDKLYIKNFLYLDKKEYDDIGKFDLIYFTGVLYHNPEQLRFCLLYTSPSPRD